MDHGPQMTTSVNSMLNLGAILLQDVGQFNGHYTILVAYMNYVVAPFLERAASTTRLH